MRFNVASPPEIGTTQTRRRFAWRPVQLDHESPGHARGGAYYDTLEEKAGDWVWLQWVKVTRVFATMWWIDDQLQKIREPNRPPNCGERMDDCRKWRTVSVTAA